ncbi:50S ribosomal protein L25 [Anaerobiospirillum succiniciproducens]|uniref:50S ribosomal protein L25 n=1 Tax=Anaerobiospirillum succiniciproducens TaxID=13335 RepID=UPI00042764E7|nr:50S ribosomal protein L25 [Anaerobiospirillum succiniciproducens]MCI6863019.1 50S ribosomal protein L25 [Anaerobiospirillum succiniciproducens]MDO4675550.1 50S ribosomal protein L25 [Anaerobiospirillum succiniciproducens]
MAITLDVELRNDLGRGASRRLRREEKIPAIIIAKGQETVSITLNEKKLIQATTKPDFFTETVTLNVGSDAIAVKPIAMQRHPVSSRIIHVDFQRV